MKADLILVNGNIYTMEDQIQCVESMAISEGKIIYLGSAGSEKEYIDENTIIEDLGGKTVLPGFIDTHVHVPGNAYTVLFNIDLYGANTVKDITERIKKFIKDHPERKEYFGRGFTLGLFPGEESQKGPRKERLDKICRDKAIVLTDVGGHIYWLNSKALEIYGIDKNTPDIEGGVIEKGKDGQIWGTLKEEAKYLFKEASFSLKQKKVAFEYMQSLLLSYGITSIGAMRQAGSQDPIPILEAMDALRIEGALKLNVSAAIEIKNNDDIGGQLENLKQLRRKYDYEKLNVGTAKFFIDGTIEGGTAYLSRPYLRGAGKGDNFYGVPLWDLDRLQKTFISVLALGMNIHIHAVGDAAVKMAIDALEVAQGFVKKDHRNCITHLQIVAPSDIKRMHDNNVIACVNPFWHRKTQSLYFESELPFLGRERAEREYPLKSLVSKGVMITCSADHPVTPNPNPMHGIECGVTRNLYNAQVSGLKKIDDMDDPQWLLNKKERLSVKDMIKAYTINGAYYLYKEKQIGSLLPGKNADYIILSHNIFNSHPLDIEDIKIEKTVVGGETVYSRGSVKESL